MTKFLTPGEFINQVRDQVATLLDAVNPHEQETALRLLAVEVRDTADDIMEKELNADDDTFDAY